MAVGLVRLGDYWYRLDGRGRIPATVYGEYELLADTEVTGSAVSSVNITGLSLDSNDEILLVSDIINPNASNTNYYLYANGLTSNYYYQRVLADSTTVSATRNSNSIMCYCEASDDTLCIANINLTENGNFTYQANSNREYGQSGIAIDKYYGTRTSTISSITQITITSSVSNGIGVGSRFWLYKRGATDE